MTTIELEEQALVATKTSKESPVRFVDMEAPIEIVTPFLDKAVPPPKVSSRIGTLNGLRGIACLSIVFHHSFLFKALSIDTIPKFEMPFGMFPSYYYPLTWLTNTMTGVDLFFVLSGFVLYLPYCTGSRTFACKVQDPSSPQLKFSFKMLFKSIIELYKHRCKRLLPLYFFSLAIFVLFWVYNPFPPEIHDKTDKETAKDFDILSAPILGELAADVSMLFIFIPGCFLPSFNNPYWTIAYEFWFSILLPVYVFAFRFVRQMGGIKASIIGAYAFMALWYFIRVATLIYTDQDHNTAIIGSYFDEFGMGMLACEIYVYISKEKQGKTNAMTWFLGGILLMTIAFMGADSIRLSLSLKNDRKERSDSLVFMTNPYVRAFLNIILTTGYTMIVIGTAFLKKEVDVKISSTKPMQYVNNVSRWLSIASYWILANVVSQVIGIMCFSIYIWHWHIYERFFNEATPDNQRGIYFVVYVIVTGLFAAASCSYIEFPKLTNKQIFIDTISE